MNIKQKLIDQISFLENLQLLATNSNNFRDALSASKLILDYAGCIATIDKDDDADDYICPDCEEAMLKESLHQEIAERCDLPIELVNRVLAGQDKVFFKDLD